MRARRRGRSRARARRTPGDVGGTVISRIALCWTAWHEWQRYLRGQRHRRRLRAELALCPHCELDDPPSDGTGAAGAQMAILRGVYGTPAPSMALPWAIRTAAMLTVEASNGVRLRQGTTDMIVLDASGNSTFARGDDDWDGRRDPAGDGNDGQHVHGHCASGATAGIGRIGGYTSNVLQWYGDTAGTWWRGPGMNVYLGCAGGYYREDERRAWLFRPDLEPSAAAGPSRHCGRAKHAVCRCGKSVWYGARRCACLAAAGSLVASTTQCTDWSHYVDINAGDATPGRQSAYAVALAEGADGVALYNGWG